VTRARGSGGSIEDPKEKLRKRDAKEETKVGKRD
jgi:hypothetical protein